MARGRLSSLDLLPDEAQDDLIWAMGELNARQRTQADILFDLNDRLAAKGIDPISSSAFNRKSMRLAKRTRQLEERRHLYAGIAEKLTPEKVAGDDLILGEFLKTLIDDLLEGDGLSPKNAMELARAYQSVVMAQGKSAETRRAMNAESRKKISETIDAAEAAMRDGTRDPAETLRKIREEIYGIFD